MNNCKLTFTIGGREALPVRAIPYVTGWQRFSPDTVAACLARTTDFFMRAHLTAYRISGDEPIQVTPRQWDAVVVKLKGLAAKLRRQHGDDDIGDDIGYDAWRSGAVKILPADAFVWLDELETEYQTDRKSQYYYETRPSDDELILEPMLDADTIAMVMKGFEKYLSEEHTVEEQAGFDPGYYAAVARDVGSVGNWDYWVSQKYLEPREVACLMFELDPKHFGDIHATNKKLLSVGALADRIDEIERSATRDTEGKNLSPAEWIEWAQGKRYAVPEKFVKAVEQFEKQKPKTSTVKQSYPVVPVVTAEHDTTKDEPPKMKRTALMDMLDKEGFKNVRDKFGHSNENGLRDAAKHKKHGYWYVDKARAWFVQEQGEPNLAKKTDAPAKKIDAPAKTPAQKNNLADYWPHMK